MSYRILVVEDSTQHLADAARIGREMGLEIIEAKTVRIGETEIATDFKPADFVPVDGVVTDIYMVFAAMPEDQSEHQAGGLVVAAAALKYKIPFVLCTAGNHHGAKYQWISSMCSNLGWRVIEGWGSDRGARHHRDYESPEKNWAEAFNALLRKIEEKRRDS